MFDQLFRSKKFVVMIIGVAATFFVERLGLSEAKMTEILTMIASFLVGQGISDMGKESVKVLGRVTNSTQSVLTDLFNSKKFRVMAVGLIVSLFSDKLGIPEEQVAYIINILAIYVFGQGIADYRKEAIKIDLEKGDE